MKFLAAGILVFNVILATGVAQAAQPVDEVAERVRAEMEKQHIHSARTQGGDDHG